MENPEPKLVLIDGSAYFYRAFFAIRPLSAPDGLPTNAVFGFVSMLLKVLDDLKPTHLAVVFDSPAKTHREELYPDYKGHRPAMPDDLVSQIPVIHDVVNAYNFPSLEQAGYEADDIIATVARMAEEENIPVWIVSGDKDMMQLISDKVVMLDTMKDKTIGIDQVKEKFGIGPEGVVDVLALMGDSVDNVPGVPGVGEKTARELIARFGTLDKVLENAAGIEKPKLRESLLQNAHIARLSKELVTLSTGVPLDVTLDDLRLKPADETKLRALFERLGFKRFLEKLQQLKTVSYDDYHLVLTAEELQSLLSELQAARCFSFDVETTSADPISAELVGISFAPRAHRAFYCPFKHSYLGAPQQLPLKQTLERLRPLLENPLLNKYGQNLKYDITVLRKYDIRVAGVACDVMLVSYLLNPAQRAHGLAALAQQYLGHKMITYEDVTGKGKKQRSFAEVDMETARTYSCEDADMAFILAEMLMAKLAEPFSVTAEAPEQAHEQKPLPDGRGSASVKCQRSIVNCSLRELLDKLEIPLLEVLVDMEMAGVRIDSTVLGELSAELENKTSSLRAKIHEAAGGEFNVDSPKQLQEVLFERLSLKRGRRTKTGYSTDNEELERLAREYPIAALVLEYRSASKLKNTYCDVLPTLVNSRTGRVHTSFNQTVTATGRLSSSDPNLQNIPIRTKEGRKIRRGFVPDEGCVFVSGDYSQVELRVLAHLSSDERLIDAFQKGEDIHVRTAAEVFGVKPDDVSDELRGRAKVINFGIIYGMSAHGLAMELGVPHDEAQRYIDAYFKRYAGVRRFLDSVLASTRETGYVTTLLGRVRPVPEIRSASAQMRAMAERIVQNTPVQGTAADLMKLAMVNLHARLRREGLRSRIILQVHDELLLEVPLEEKAKAVRALSEEMQSALPMAVPLKVDTTEGKNWGNMTKLTIDH